MAAPFQPLRLGIARCQLKVEPVAGEQFQFKMLQRLGVHAQQPVGSFHPAMLRQKIFADQCKLDAPRLDIRRRILVGEMHDPA